nr:unnamed protein product [Callosobruchus analis]
MVTDCNALKATSVKKVYTTELPDGGYSVKSLLLSNSQREWSSKRLNLTLLNALLTTTLEEDLWERLPNVQLATNNIPSRSTGKTLVNFYLGMALGEEVTWLCSQNFHTPRKPSYCEKQAAKK